MKAIKRKIRKKGFSLVECMVAMAIFAMMATIVMQILGIAITRNLRNHQTEKDIDAQIENVVDDNSLTDRETMTMAFKFMTQEGTEKTLSISDVQLKFSDTGFENGYQINTFNKDFGASGSDDESSDESSDSEDEGIPGLVKSYNHIYGTTGIDFVEVRQIDKPTSGDVYTVKWKIKVHTSDKILSDSVANSIKVAVPKSAYNLKVSPGVSLDYKILVNYDLKSREKTGTTVRFADKDPGSKEAQYGDIEIRFDMAKADYVAEYKSVVEYFYRKCTDAQKGASGLKVQEGSINGIYDDLLTTIS